MAAAERIRSNRPEILHSLEAAAAGNPYAAEPDSSRRRARLQAKAGLSRREADAIDRTIENTAAEGRGGASYAKALTEAAESGPSMRLLATPAAAEKVWGDTLDFVGVSFLEKGARIARAVGRVAFRNSSAQGSGFLVGNGLFITNHHVVPNAAFARNLALEFDFELDLTGNRKPITRFAIDTRIFVTDPDTPTGLDYTIFAVGERIEGELPIENFGWSGLSDSDDRHMLGEFANIVQHPSGRYKEVVLRENRLVGRYANALHYVADTEPGSSGSPVFNSEWRPIALHHWGAPWREIMGDDGSPLDVEVNEGIRISAIVRHLRQRLRSLDPFSRDRLARALDMGAAPESPGDRFEPDPATLARRESASGSARMDEFGRVTWTVPLEISVQMPGFGRTGEPAPATGSSSVIAEQPGPERPPSSSYRDRSGYKRGFIEGFDIPLPGLSDSLIADAARNKAAEAGDDPFELKYHHFSAVVNRRRRLAFFTACNIDGASAKAIDRRTKTVTPLRPDGAGLERAESLADAEAEAWLDDDRLEPDEYTGEAFYERQKIPGFPDPKSRGRIARMFQKGHLVRRLDPCWGEDDLALQAEQDSFHWTNCSPQVGFFNQGTADPDTPGTGGGALWRAVENYVLRNAVAEKQRVTSFTGPIFDPEDREYRGVKVPNRFFKVTVWAEGGSLKALAMIADQSRVIDRWPEALRGEGAESLSEAEAFMDADELKRVEDFLSTIAEVETATGLDFGDAVRSADVRPGGATRKVEDSDEIPVGAGSPRGRGRAPARSDGRGRSPASRPGRARPRRSDG